MGMYYDADKTLSRQRLFNFVVGPRGAGKTYGAKKKAIKDFIRKGNQFVYLRRYETEMPASQMRNFFDDVGVEFPDHEFKAHNGLFRIDNEIAGWYFPLSKATMLKSIPFPNVTLIIFDEFIIDVGVYHYLPSEVKSFLECYSTISRDRDIPVLFLSNAITFTNPYFLYFNLSLEEGQTLKMTQDISLELVKNDEYTKHAQSTRFGRLVEGTDYGRYAVQNQFLLDSDTFIGQMPQGCGYIATLYFSGNAVGLYRSLSDDLFFLSEKTDETCKVKLVMTKDDHNENTMLVLHRNLIISTFLEYFAAGRVRFESIKVKNLAYNTMKGML